MKKIIDVKIIFLCAFIFLFYQNINAQSAWLYDLRDGLTSTHCRTLVTDKNGFIWIGTAKGIMRFDGYRFIPYNEENFDSTLSYRTGSFALFCDSKNRIWTASEKGANYFDQTLHRFFYLKVNLYKKNPVMRGFCEDKNGTVYICGDDGLFYFNEKENKIIPLFSFNGPVKKNIEINWNSIAYDELRNGIWCGTSEEGMALCDLKKNELKWMDEIFPALKNRIKRVPICMVKKDANDDLWFANSRTGELFNFNLKTEKLKQYFYNEKEKYNAYDNYLFSISENMNHRRWLAGRGYGIFYTDNKDSVLYNYGNNFGTIYSVTEDFQGNAWFGTSKGILRINYIEQNIERFPIEQISKEPEFPLGTVKSDYLGNLYISTTNEGFYTFDTKTKKIKNLIVNKNQSSSNNIYNFEIVKNKIVTTTWGNAFQQNNDNTFSSLLPEKSEGNNLMKNNIIFHAVQDKNNFCCVNIRGVGIYKFSSEGKIIYKTDSTYPAKLFYSMCVLKNGNIIAGTDRSGGLLWLDENLKIKKWWSMNVASDSLHDSRIDNLYEDENGMIWICSRSGIQLLDLKNLKIRNAGKIGKIESHSVPFYETKTHIYFNTANRIVKINKASFEVEGNLSNTDLQVGSFLGGAAFCKNYIWIFADHQLIKISADLLNENQKKYSLIPSSLRIFNENKNINSSQKNFQLKYNENFFTIDFSDLDFTQTTGKKFRYILKGFENKWFTTTTPTVAFTNVPPGNYILNIEAILPTGKTHNFNFDIEIIPPWWQTIIFRIFILLVLIFIIYFSIKTYIKNRLRKQKTELEKMKAVQQERLRISSEIHDDLGSELTSIRLISEVIKQKINSEKTEINVKQEVDFISDRASNMVDRLNQIVWALNPENDQSLSLISYSRRYLQNYFNQHSINCKITVPSPIPEILLSLEQRQNFFLCVKEIAHNIVKHSGADDVKCKFDLVNNSLIFEVNDNGKKNPDYAAILEVSSGNGLNNIKRRMNILEGSFDIFYSDGTIVKLTMKI